MRNWLQAEMLRANFHTISDGTYRSVPLTLHTRLPGKLGDGPSAVLRVRAKVRRLRFVAGGRGTAMEHVRRGQVRVEDSNPLTDSLGADFSFGGAVIQPEGEETGLGSYFGFTWQFPVLRAAVSGVDTSRLVRMKE